MMKHVSPSLRELNFRFIPWSARLKGPPSLFFFISFVRPKLVKVSFIRYGEIPGPLSFTFIHVLILFFLADVAWDSFSVFDLATVGFDTFCYFVSASFAPILIDCVLEPSY